MKMPDKIPTLKYLHSFYVLVECGSVAEAVNNHRISRPTLSRHIKLLEEELGKTLFLRTNDSYKLTADGYKVHIHAQSIFKIANEMFDEVTTSGSDLSGKVTVVSSSGIAALILPNIFKKLPLLGSNIELHIKPVANVTKKLVEENDISVQTYRPTQKNLIARKIGTIRCGAYASLDYLKEKGTPQNLSELKYHFLVGAVATNSLKDAIKNSWKLKFPDQIIHLHCDDSAVAWRMVVDGCGIGVTHISTGDDEPRVKRVLPELPNLTFPIWLVTHAVTKNTQKIKFIYDLITEETAHLR